MKILVAVPTFENIYPDTFKSIYDLDKGEHEVFFEFVRGYDCATARNKIAQKALDMGVDYVLMVDNDVVLPRDAIMLFLEEPKSVQLGSYAHRDTDNIYRGRTCICKLKDNQGKAYYNYPLDSEYTATELQELRDSGKYKIMIHGGGMGCAFINTGVFKAISYPWYDWVNYKTKGMLSEDLYFCEQCKSKRIPVYTDTRVTCGHILRRIQYVE